MFSDTVHTEFNQNTVGSFGPKVHKQKKCTDGHNFLVMHLFHKLHAKNPYKLLNSSSKMK